MQIAKDSTQTLVAYPSTHLKLTSAGVRVRTGAVSLPDAEDVATVESATIDTVTNAAALEGSTRLGFASVPSVIKGRKYVVDIDEVTFPVEVAGIDTAANEIILAQPLPQAVESGAEFRGWAISHALTTTETALSGLAFARWSIVVGGLAVDFNTPFDIVTHSNPYLLTWGELGQRKPHLHDEKPAHDDTGAETIRAAWDDHVVPSLEEKGVRPEFIVSQFRLVALHAAAVELVLFPRDDKAQENFDRKVTQTLRSKAFWYDENEGKADSLSTGDEGNGEQFVGVRFFR